MNLRDKYKNGIPFDAPSARVIGYSTEVIEIVDFTSLRTYIRIPRNGKWGQLLDAIIKKRGLPADNWEA